MKEIIISDVDVADANINLAKNFLINAYASENEDEKVKSLVMARGAVDKSIEALGCSFEEIKIKKEKNICSLKNKDY